MASDYGSLFKASSTLILVLKNTIHPNGSLENRQLEFRKRNFGNTAKFRKRNFGNTAKFRKPPRLFQKYDNKRFHVVSYCQGLQRWNITWNFLLLHFWKNPESFRNSAVLPIFRFSFPSSWCILGIYSVKLVRHAIMDFYLKCCIRWILLCVFVCLFHDDLTYW